MKQNKGVKIIATGVGPLVDKADLIQIADDKEENVVQVSELSKLVQRLKKFFKSLAFLVKK